MQKSQRLAKKMSKTDGKKSKFCPECNNTAEETNKFCKNCGYKLIVTEEIVDKHGHELKVTQTVESEFPIEIPKGLTLLPKEVLLSQHGDWYVSNKRIIEHQPGFFKGKTQDWHLRHIKGTEEKTKKPFMPFGIIIGCLLLLAGISLELTVLTILGILLIIFTFWYKISWFTIQHMSEDGKEIVLRVEKINSKTGEHFIQAVRKCLYGKP